MRDVAELGTDPFAVIADDCVDIARRLDGDARCFAGRTILVTGAAGMLPAYLVDTLAQLNDSGFLSPPARLLLVVRSVAANEGRLTHLRERDDVRFVIADAATPFDPAERADFLVHAASPASPDAYLADPLGTLSVNGVGTRHVLDLARRHDAASVLYVSTSEVYGTPGPDHVPTPETFVGTTPWLGGRASYVEGKRFGEALCEAAWTQYRVRVKIARPFHVHGPGMRLSDGRIVPTLIRMGLRGEAFALKSAGRATRTYGYVADAAYALFRILLSDQEGEVFNVGADAPETSMLELATLVSRLFGREEPVRVNTDPDAKQLAGGPARVRPDLGKLRERLGVAPEVSLEAGLRRTIHWHRTRMGQATKPA